MKSYLVTTIFLLYLALTGCASAASTPPTLTPTPLLPYSAGANALVWLEDQCEDPYEDARTLTSLEAFADLFMLPVTVAVYVARVTAIVTIAMPRALLGYDTTHDVERIKYILQYPLAGPNPDYMHYPRRHPGAALDAEAYKVKPHPSCLFTENQP